MLSRLGFVFSAMRCEVAICVPPEVRILIAAALNDLIGERLRSPAAVERGAFIQAAVLRTSGSR